jgi:hypothetical protein
MPLYVGGNAETPSGDISWIFASSIKRRILLPTNVGPSLSEASSFGASNSTGNQKESSHQGRLRNAVLSIASNPAIPSSPAANVLNAFSDALFITEIMTLSATGCAPRVIREKAPTGLLVGNQFLKPIRSQILRT